MADKAGLYGKYTVSRVDGKPVDWCFVLEPDDLLARRALALYAELAEADGNTGLADDLREKVGEQGGTEDEGVLTSRDMIAVYAQQGRRLREQVTDLQAQVARQGAENVALKASLADWGEKASRDDAELRGQVERLEGALEMLRAAQTSWWLIRLDAAKRSWETQHDVRAFWNSIILEREDVTRRVADILARAALEPREED